MPHIIFLNKNYKAEKEILITQGEIFADGYKADTAVSCSVHPLKIISGKLSWENGKLFIK